jgi:hypothetical protein
MNKGPLVVLIWYWNFQCRKKNALNYYGIFARVNMWHQMFMILCHECNSSPIDDYIKHKLYEPH